MQHSKSKNAHRSPTDSFTKISFDYIVGRGGMTGLVVVARLSEDPDVVVGVFEAGPQHEEVNPLIDVSATMGDPTYDWMTMTTPQEQANNRLVSISRGKGLGETSAVGLGGIGAQRLIADEFHIYKVGRQRKRLVD
ncbi:choline dehydrogenase [Moniliophthora roreri]|nr:choline dehydrogenase [Moniliophthora roreri]